MRGDAVPITRAAPRIRATCTARCPTPPAAACTSTVSPDDTPTLRNACNDVRPVSASPPASSNDNDAGLCANPRSVAAISSAYVPCCTWSLRW